MGKHSKRLTALLTDHEACRESLVGGKGAKLSRLMEAGFQVPSGFCVTVEAYRLFVDHNRLVNRIGMELDRKPAANMRWEELWDSALRIRSAFLAGSLPDELFDTIQTAYRDTLTGKSMVVRSSALDEDSARSFAGLHDSIIGVRGMEQLIKSLRIVWASLWSDAALLYRSEMGLDPASSAMAVVVQEEIPGGPSGIAFGRDPRDLRRNVAIIEAVPGMNKELVDGDVDPDRWVLDRASGKVVDTRQGLRAGSEKSGPLLLDTDLHRLLQQVLAVEKLFGWPADIEWTGRADRLKLLQARPVTVAREPAADDKRPWYLSLRPPPKRLKELADRVSNQLIPELTALGDELAGEDVEALTDTDLADTIKQRLEIVERWRRIYFDDFIPLAHGVRQLGMLYNTVVEPEDPYEFMGLLKGESMLASRRNAILAELADLLREQPDLRDRLERHVRTDRSGTSGGWELLREAFAQSGPGRCFWEKLDHLLTHYTDLSFDGERLSNHPELYIHAIMELSRAREATGRPKARDRDHASVRRTLEQKLLAAVDETQLDAAKETLALGRLSWRLRDDDNMLVGRLESQLLRALQVSAVRLQTRGHLNRCERLTDRSAMILADALVHPPDEPINLIEPPGESTRERRPHRAKPRQLVGQPAGPGIASGTACVVSAADDLLRVRQGQVMVCDAIQPNMTHIVPLVSAIVERRGGMLIHGAIIARELGIPCVNGVDDAVRLIANDEILTVDGYLGIVTVGAPELDREKETDDRDTGESNES